MHERSVMLALATGLTLASELACNGSDARPPETAADTTTTTGASAAPPPQPAALPAGAPPSAAPNQMTPQEDRVPATHPVPIAPEATPGLSTSGAPPASAATTSPTAATAEPLDDAQIVEILETQDAIALKQGREATQKARSEGVRQFAQGLVRDARATDEKLAAILRKNPVSPRSSRAANDLRSRNDAITSNLKSSDRSDFDRVFVDAAVAEQAKALDLLENTLIPAARDAELRKLLESMRTKVALHLSDAEVLQATPGKTQ